MVQFSLSSDFPDGLDSTKLHKAISASAISVALVGISTCGDDVIIEFGGSPTGDDITLLGELIEAHTPELPDPKETYSIPVNRSTKLTYYEVLTAFLYDPRVRLPPSSITIVSTGTGTITSYIVRLYDATNNTVICSNTLHDVSLMPADMGVLSNLPTNTAVLELQAKKIDGGADDIVFITDLSFYCN